VGAAAQPAQGVRRLLHGRAEQAWLQGEVEDHRGRAVLGNLKSNPQTGFADWIQDFPNPSDFYLLLDKNAIQPTNNQNFSQVNDPHIQSELAKLNPVPSDKLDTVAQQWQRLDEYVAKKAYVAVYGQQQAPKFYSNKINFQSAVFTPLYGNDWSSLELNSNQ
jgi:peptide/nickel transport system substrate-binding protein